MKQKIKSIQINENFETVSDFDQVLNFRQIYQLLGSLLDSNSLQIININGRKYIEYKHNSRSFIILPKSITYLGKPHPLHKKRIQISKHFQSLYFSQKYSNHIFVILGVYKYNKTTIFCTFQSSQYMKKSSNNSSAHLNTDDILNTLKKGVYTRVDRYGNVVNFYDIYHLSSVFDTKDEYKYEEVRDFKFIEKLVSLLPLNKEINVLDAVKEMKEANDPNWRQSEWPGFYLEYLIKNALINDANTEIKYLGDERINKNKKNLDFDLFFEQKMFFADIKSSDINEKWSLGNDKEHLMNAIEKYKRFWYIIFEHKTIKDKDLPVNQRLVYEWNKLKKSDKEDSYWKKLKNTVEYKNVIVVELNNHNFEKNIQLFKQGKQPDGSKRKVKVSIDKSNKQIVIYKKPL
ncbi:hypothetical protein E1I18_03405 [Mycoplasmopsis mucosicanis]|uniref:Methylase-associated X1 domain-containing protein n=1 Tax=Mycoplasmopsis mucosicanis TaxID=458208 RepID=A0A507SPJ4_9BACT|nr:hypothetical protein [Mycoplasmopsis mucosicanis]TQC51282.1 hypothetical protein E1I18_03405 [Mycoplasmopsis mucosicanis]